MFNIFTDFFSILNTKENSSSTDNNYFSVFMDNFEGKDFYDGLYRIHYKSDIEKWNSIITEMYPDFKDKFTCFSYDWLGRHFALDLRNKANTHVLMFEPGTADVLEIPCIFKDFHEVEIPSNTDACLSYNYYNTWKKRNPGKIQHNKCVGYIIPLFLGGTDSIDNLELNDMEVYWYICGSAKNGT